MYWGTLSSAVHAEKKQVHARMVTLHLLHPLFLLATPESCGPQGYDYLSIACMPEDHSVAFTDQDEVEATVLYRCL